MHRYRLNIEHPDRNSAYITSEDLKVPVITLPGPHPNLKPEAAPSIPLSDH